MFCSCFELVLVLTIVVGVVFRDGTFVDFITLCIQSIYAETFVKTPE